MAAGIFGERWMGRREPAWHGLGTVFPADTKMTPAEAVLRCGLDYHVQKYPLVVHLPDGQTIASDKVAIVREPTHDDGVHRVLGYAGKEYEVVQNLELGFMLERLADEWPVETVGGLNEGRDVFITLDAGASEVGGDEVRQYFLLSNSHTGGRSLKIAVTPVRVVCQNTLIAGTAAASILSTLPHTINVRAEVNYRVDLIASMRRQQQRLMESFEAMARFPITTEQRDEVIAAAYPLPKEPKRKVLNDLIIRDNAVKDNKQLAAAVLSGAAEVTLDWEREVKRIELHRSAARDRMEVFNQEFHRTANKMWAVYNAVTELECWREGNKTEGANERVGQSILFGQRAQTMGRAYNRAVAIMEAGA